MGRASLPLRGLSETPRPQEARPHAQLPRLWAPGKRNPGASPGKGKPLGEGKAGTLSASSLPCRWATSSPASPPVVPSFLLLGILSAAGRLVHPPIPRSRLSAPQKPRLLLQPSERVPFEASMASTQRLLSRPSFIRVCQAPSVCRCLWLAPPSHKGFNTSSRFGKRSHEALGREGEVRQGKEESS